MKEIKLPIMNCKFCMKLTRDTDTGLCADCWEVVKQRMADFLTSKTARDFVKKELDKASLHDVP